MAHVSRSAIRPALLGVSALAALWGAQSCLAPGSLDHEETYRIEGDASTLGEGGPSSGSGGSQGTMGCSDACNTFQSTCATTGCHTTDNPQSGLDLQSPGLVARISNAPAQSSACTDETLLVPGDPNKSLIYTKLLSKPGCGLRMPLTGALSDPDIDCVRRWVLAPSCDGDASPETGGASGNGGNDGSGGAGNGGSSGSGGAGGVNAGGMSSGGMNGNGGRNTGGMNGNGGRNTGGMNGNGGMAGAGGMNGNGGAGGMNGNGGAGGSMPMGAVVYVEAEDGTLVDPMAVGMDAAASGGKYISVATGAPKVDDPTMSTMGTATFMLNITTAGNYAAFARVEAMSTSSDSFWVKMDDGAFIQWNNVMNATAWAWDTIHDSGMADMPVHFQLSAGTHTLVIMYREAGAEIDKLAFGTDPGFMPTGTGQ